MPRIIDWRNKNEGGCDILLLKNLRSLKEDMESKEWSITSFIFTYKKINYIVLVKRFIDIKKKNNQYALVELKFVKKNKLDDCLKVEANSVKLFVEPKRLREYFGIAYVDNLGDIITQFYEKFGKVIPMKVNDNYSDLEKKVMVSSLSISDSEDPRKRYCSKIRRNPEGQKRSVFNTDKTKLLRRALFEYFKEDESISFCYSMEQNNENDDATILNNFSKH